MAVERVESKGIRVTILNALDELDQAKEEAKFEDDELTVRRASESAGYIQEIADLASVREVLSHSNSDVVFIASGKNNILTPHKKGLVLDTSGELQIEWGRYAMGVWGKELVEIKRSPFPNKTDELKLIWEEDFGKPLIKKVARFKKSDILEKFVATFSKLAKDKNLT